MSTICNKKNGRLVFFVMLFGLTMIAVYGFMTNRHCVCRPCVVICSDPSASIPLDQDNHCHCTSYASQLFQSAFGHKERHSETMTKSTGPCETKSSPH